MHVLARDEEGALVSHAEFVPRWLQAGGHEVMRTAYVEAVATAPGHQRKGSPPRCCSGSSTWWPPIPAWQLAALSPSDAGFYERLGWELWRGPLAIRHAGRLEPSPDDEQVMIRRLPRTPPLDTDRALDSRMACG